MKFSDSLFWLASTSDKHLVVIRELSGDWNVFVIWEFSYFLKGIGPMVKRNFFMIEWFCNERQVKKSSFSHLLTWKPVFGTPAYRSVLLSVHLDVSISCSNTFKKTKWGTVTHACNPSTRETETVGLPWVQGHPGPQSQASANKAKQNRDWLSVLGKRDRQSSGTFSPLRAWKELVFIYLMNIFVPYLVTLKVIMCLNSNYLNSV